jgi:hypothetical protein
VSSGRSAGSFFVEFNCESDVNGGLGDRVWYFRYNARWRVESREARMNSVWVIIWDELASVWHDLADIWQEVAALRVDNTSMSSTNNRTLVLSAQQCRVHS